MKKIIIAVICVLSSINAFATNSIPNALTATTKDSKVEVMIVGHSDSITFVSRAGITYRVKTSDLNITPEVENALKVLDNNKTLANKVYETGMRISKKSTNKTCVDIMISQDVLETLQEKASK